jgi:2-polyprenyl-3-methyl-5-hydroxy-6-metoxy-1,4-benzoquinol methylase
MSMWDERYSDPEYVYGTAPNTFLADVVDQIPKGKVLSLAEGEGRNAVFLAEQGHKVLAVDASVVGLSKAQRLADQRGVTIETRVADLANFAIEPDSWDAIVSMFCHLPSGIRSSVHHKIVAGLKPGGVLVLEAYTPEQLLLKTGGPAAADLTMNLTMLKKELEGLRFIHARELERDVIEGKFHTGRGAVVQVVAVKP